MFHNKLEDFTFEGKLRSSQYEKKFSENILKVHCEKLLELGT